MRTKACSSPKLLKSPVLFLVFNRPDTTRQVFEAIRQAQPSQLFIAADGPRESKAGEAEKCVEVRRIVDEGIDWDCKVHRLYRTNNVGCKVAVSSAIDWFFDNVEEGIILEDDCLPHPTFFRFCEELLNKYRNDNRIGQISGVNFQFGKKRMGYSYYFSRYTHIWGWASWRRAWKNYNVDMKLWPEIRDSGWLQDWLRDKKLTQYWMRIFEKVYLGKIDTWDYQWIFACWMQNGLTILPNVNLISNIGFGKEAVHTKKKSLFANMVVEAIDFPLNHPPFVIRDEKADRFTEKTHFRRRRLFLRIPRKLFKILRGHFRQ